LKLKNIKVKVQRVGFIHIDHHLLIFLAEETYLCKMAGMILFMLFCINIFE